MRAFIAVDIVPDVVSEIEALVERLRGQIRGARWVTPQNLHLTLRFLGETNEKVIHGLSETVATALRTYPPFALEFRGIGFFPNARKPRVLWAGIHEPPEVVVHLHRVLEEAAAKHGFEPERRAFSPHLTLARFRRPQSDPKLTELARLLEQHPFGSSIVEEVVLYRSILKPSGAEYHVLRRFPLKATD